MVPIKKQNFQKVSDGRKNLRENVKKTNEAKENVIRNGKKKNDKSSFRLLKISNRKKKKKRIYSFVNFYPYWFFSAVHSIYLCLLSRGEGGAIIIVFTVFFFIYLFICGVKKVLGNPFL